ncbi:MAG: NAD(P)-dependent oxidoreductase [Formosimonas sp.]
MSVHNKIGFIGLGVMGGAMAGHVLRERGQLAVFNRSAAKAAAWQQAHQQATVYDDVAALAQAVDAVVLCVGNDDDVRQTVRLLLPHLPAGALIIDHTTTSPALAVEMSALCGPSGVAFIDAPVSGGQAGAVNGTLTVMAGGDAQAFAQAQRIMSAYAKHMQHFGASGAGQGCKMVNQVLIAGVLQGLSEGMHLAQHLGLDPTALVHALQHGAAGSWQLAQRGVSMSAREFDFGFAIDWMRKDLGIVNDYAAAHALDLPLMQSVRHVYDDLSAAGFGRNDTSALIRQFDNGLAQPPKSA